MAVVLRLNRIGGKGKPFYRVIATDSRKAPTAGDSLEQIGSYDPRVKGGFKVDMAKIDAWLKKGAKASPTLAKLIKLAKEAPKA